MVPMHKLNVDVCIQIMNSSYNDWIASMYFKKIFFYLEYSFVASQFAEMFEYAVAVWVSTHICTQYLLLCIGDSLISYFFTQSGDVVLGVMQCLCAPIEVADIVIAIL